MAALGPLAARGRAVFSSSRGAALLGCQAQHASSQQPQVLSHERRPATQTVSSSSSSLLPSQQQSSFSTSPVLERRRRYKPRDNNRLRGVSSMRRTGPREFLSVSDSPIPRPALRAPIGEPLPAEAQPATDPDHGLWQFFYDQKVAQTPLKDAAYGRAWTVEELRRKSWDDLHRLWWVCVKERNRIATASKARQHFKLGYGDYEATERDFVVKRTMKGIKHVLAERFYVWEDAVDLAQSDPEIDLSGEGPAFQPKEYLEEAEVLEVEDASKEATAATTPEVPAGEQRAPMR